MADKAGIDPDLEREYNQRARVPEHAEIFARWARVSEILRAGRECSLGVAYAAHARQAVDILHAPDPVATLAFIHGGYWRSLDKSMFSFVAAPFLARRITVALVGYRLCPEVPLASVVNDCAQALDELVDRSRELGLPMQRYALAGHSAGGQLATMMLTRKASALHAGLCAVASLSGLFVLEPLLRCSMNVDLCLDEASARQGSPALLAPAHDLPVCLETGDQETEAFRAQSALLKRAWPGMDIEACEVHDANHFTIVDAFASGEARSTGFLFEHLLRD